jgi:hypothetical protein
VCPSRWNSPNVVEPPKKKTRIARLPPLGPG